ncbi:pseudaminic acid cytidylyltransferase [Vibrio maritimus]|uniref:pseudaminic acid cytidylyltransferase n=1 Tax=Vibrio maritimus TaxID=990268 RepID=UPI001F2A278F|nr:pseudaminic acid cytidylyltransferase [Vibrio maritimus]
MKVAIIPARGGSKRIPRKNIKEFNGKPIIAYSIEAAIASGCFERVIVSTDDEEIAVVARQYGAEVPSLRSSKTSDDHAPIVDVVLETLDMLERTEEVSPTYLCCIFATAPFVNGERIEKAYQTMLSKQKDGIFPVVEFSYPIQRSLEIKSNGNVGMVWPEHLLSRSQDLPPRYHDTGQYYWVKTESVRKEKTLFIKNCMVEPISNLQAQDIDVEADWLLAELKFKAFAC